MIPAISTTALSRRYRDQAALDDVSLVVEPGTVTGLLGRNGAGKTTLMRIVTGQEFPTRGAIRVFGQAPARNGTVRPPARSGAYRIGAGRDSATGSWNPASNRAHRYRPAPATRKAVPPAAPHLRPRGCGPLHSRDLSTQPKGSLGSALPALPTKGTTRAAKLIHHTIKMHNWSFGAQSCAPGRMAS